MESCKVGRFMCKFRQIEGGRVVEDVAQSWRHLFVSYPQ